MQAEGKEEVEENGMLAFRRLIHELLERILQGLLGHSADDGVELLAIFEDHNGGNAANAILASDIRRFVGVELYSLHLALVLTRELIDQRCDHAAWPTPWRPEVNQHWHIRVQHLVLERRVRHSARARCTKENHERVRSPSIKESPATSAYRFGRSQEFQPGNHRRVGQGEPEQAGQEAHKRRHLERSALGLDSVVSFAARVGVGARGRARGAAGCAPLAAGAGADAFATPPMPAFPPTAFSVWIRTPLGGSGALQNAVFPD